MEFEFKIADRVCHFNTENYYNYAEIQKSGAAVIGLAALTTSAIFLGVASVKTGFNFINYGLKLDIIGAGLNGIIASGTGFFAAVIGKEIKDLGFETIYDSFVATKDFALCKYESYNSVSEDVHAEEPAFDAGDNFASQNEV